jgi:hypothetical protein
VTSAKGSGVRLGGAFKCAAVQALEEMHDEAPTL